MEDIILETQGLTKRYGDLTAVDSLDLSVRRGEVFGLLGPNGAGKTTTTLMLLGLTEPTAGTAAIAGHDCTREPIAIKRMVGYLPDNVGFYGDMTGRENLRFTGRLNGLGGDALEARIGGLLRRVGLEDAADRKAGTYSRGMRQRLGVADVLIKDPKVIIMDEPTLGIDPEGMRALLSLIRDLAAKDRRTILLSSGAPPPGPGRRPGNHPGGRRVDAALVHGPAAPGEPAAGGARLCAPAALPAGRRFGRNLPQILREGRCPR